LFSRDAIALSDFFKTHSIDLAKNIVHCDWMELPVYRIPSTFESRAGEQFADFVRCPHKSADQLTNQKSI
jgi:hypothetical protein